jgi:hypothetical protein
MTVMFHQILDWLEVWSLFIPLIVLLKKRKQPGYLKPVIIYLWLALIINLLANISWKFKSHYNFPVWYQTNTYFYNIHSIVRFFLFSWFFIILRQPFFLTLKKLLPVLFLTFIIINFTFIEYFVNYWYANGKLNSLLSSNLLTMEAGFLLLYCLLYYFYLLKEDQPFFTKLPSFWVVTGLSIFVVIGFPIYLFYAAAIEHSKNFIINIWLVQKFAYLIFCILIAKAFIIESNAGS